MIHLVGTGMKILPRAWDIDTRNLLAIPSGASMADRGFGSGRPTLTVVGSICRTQYSDMPSIKRPKVFQVFVFRF